MKMKEKYVRERALGHWQREHKKNKTNKDIGEGGEKKESEAKQIKDKRGTVLCIIE